jgi:hypothetical protein
VDWSLGVTDRAGNLAATTSMGSLHCRGVIQGSVLPAGQLIVEAYDLATLRPVVGAEVLVDPFEPVVPAAAGRQIGVTGDDGRAVFTGLMDSRHTITIVKAGYDLVTLYDSPTAFASLPLKPQAADAALATLAGAATFPSEDPGLTAVFGSNLLAIPGLLNVASTAQAPTVLAPQAILPNRPQVLTAFGGLFEPTSNPSFSSHACNLLGADLLSPTPPAQPPAAGATQTAALSLREVGAGAAALIPYAGIDFDGADGFLAGSLAAPFVVRFASSVDGLLGQATVGIGFATGLDPANQTVNGSWSVPILDGLASFGRRDWILIEGRDTAGGFCRTRARLDSANNTASIAVQPQPLHIQDPAAALTLANPPRIELYDAIDTLQVRTTTPGQFATGLLGIYELFVSSAAGRGWRVLREDRDGGTTPPQLLSYQFPAAGAEPTLGVGVWTVAPLSRLFSAESALAGDLMLGEREHREVTLSVAPPILYSVQ